MAKLYAHWTCVNARDAHGLHVSSGILFNHESPLRGTEFVTRKVTRAAARIAAGLQHELRVGNLAARRDWVTRASTSTRCTGCSSRTRPRLRGATGVSHSVGDLVELAFAAVDLDWREHVVVDEQLLRPLDVHVLVGDATKAREQLGWQPRTSFAELVQLMVEADVELAERELRAGGVAPA